MSRWLLVLVACGLGVWAGWRHLHAMPQITAFTGYEHTCMGYRSCATFQWETRHAAAITLEIGYVEGEMFIPGVSRFENLPPSDSLIYNIHIDNFTARLCVQGANDQTVCSICNPFIPELCGQ